MKQFNFSLLILLASGLFYEGIASSTQKVQIVSIDESNIVKFRNTSGKTIKEIELTTPDKPGKNILKERHVGTHAKYGKIIVERRYERKAYLPNNKQYVVIVEGSINRVMKDDKYVDGEDSSVFWSMGKIQYYDGKGKLLWEEITPKNIVIRNVVISDDGKTIAYIRKYEIGGLPKGELFSKLYVRDNKGRYIYIYPDQEQVVYKLYDDLRLSPNGRYLGIRGTKRNKSANGMDNYNIFVDLVVKKTYAMLDREICFTIDNNGIVEFDYIEKPKESIDLKEYFGE